MDFLNLLVKVSRGMTDSLPAAFTPPQFCSWFLKYAWRRLVHCPEQRMCTVTASANRKYHQRINIVVDLVQLDIVWRTLNIQASFNDSNYFRGGIFTAVFRAAANGERMPFKPGNVGNIDEDVVARIVCKGWWMVHSQLGHLVLNISLLYHKKLMRTE